MFRVKVRRLRARATYWSDAIGGRRRLKPLPRLPREGTSRRDVGETSKPKQTSALGRLACDGDNVFPVVDYCTLSFAGTTSDRRAALVKKGNLARSRCNTTVSMTIEFHITDQLFPSPAPAYLIGYR